ncbi:MAG: DUF192 domain-containing protein [Altererythrobacter sp.]|nr:DUF192 domain-containing protein [Altererythrobacter sp.]
MKRFAAAGLIAALAACSPQPAAEAATAAATDTAQGEGARHPVSGLAVVPLTITTAKGRHAFRVEVAATAAEQQKGLMFRTEMGPFEGMIFPNSVPQQRSFWMKNTVIPLDIIYIGPDRRVLNIVRGEPYDETSLPSTGPVINVLELAAGRSAALGIRPGDQVAW